MTYRAILGFFIYFYHRCITFPDLGMTLTLNDDGKLAIQVAYCLQVLKMSIV